MYSLLLLHHTTQTNTHTHAQVCEPRVLFGMRSDARDLATSSDVEAWMWSGVRTDAALEKFAREGEGG